MLPGKYNAEFRVTSIDGLSSSENVLIEIEDPEVLSVKSIIEGINPSGFHQDNSLKAGFQNQGNVPVEINFDAVIEGKNPIQKYQWDFEGDGIFDYTSLGPGAVKHTYYEPGVYTPTVRITGLNNVSSQDKKQIRFGISGLDGIKKGRIVVNSQKADAGLAVRFTFETESLISGAEYLWDFDNDGAIDLITKEPEAEFTYNDSGACIAKLEVRTADEIAMSCRETIYVTNGKPKEQENYAGAESYSARNSIKNVFKNRREKVMLLDKTSLILPADMLEQDDVVNIKRLDPSQIQKEINLNKNKSAGEYREYEFENLQDPFDKEMVISIPYLDLDENGIVDGADVDELTLDAYWYDDKSGEWKMLADSLVFPKENIVTVKTNHFTVFGIAGAEKKDEDIPQPENPDGDPGGNTGGNGGGSGGSCFIATAAFGSPMAREVVALRGFRDKYLLRRDAGKKFVDYYYRFSPKVAEFIKDKPLLKSLIRAFLKFIVALLTPVV